MRARRATRAACSARVPHRASAKCSCSRVRRAKRAALRWQPSARCAGIDRLRVVLPDIFAGCQHPNTSVREGYMGLFVYLPAVRRSASRTARAARRPSDRGCSFGRPSAPNSPASSTRCDSRIPSCRLVRAHRQPCAHACVCVSSVGGPRAGAEHGRRGGHRARHGHQGRAGHGVGLRLRAPRQAAAAAGGGSCQPLVARAAGAIPPSLRGSDEWSEPAPRHRAACS